MRDDECVRFLQWALPRLRMRWPGFRKVRGQVCKRIRRRLEELGCPGVDPYRDYLATHSDEWRVLEGFCRITISRFYRDRHVFEALGQSVLPELARQAASRGASELRCWSAGCASGEEPYALALQGRFVLEPRFPRLSLRVVASDVDPVLLERARRACYPESSIRNLPPEWKEAAFFTSGEERCLREELRAPVELIEQDIRIETPEGRFDLILCRNLVFTYFDESLQLEIQKKLMRSLLSGGALVVGEREVPVSYESLEPWIERSGIYRKEEVDDSR